MKKRFTNQFKAETAIELLQGNKTIGQISSERKVAATQLSQWRAIALKGLPRLFEDEQRELEKQQSAHEQEMEKLYAEIGRLTSELNWLKKDGRRVESINAGWTDRLGQHRVRHCQASGIVESESERSVLRAGDGFERRIVDQAQDR